MRPLVTLCVLVLCGCSGASDGEKTREAATRGSGGTVHSMEVVNRCAGFGAAQAAELLGVAAADLEPRFEQVTPTYAQDRKDAGHIQREFELTFSVNLNAPVRG